MIALVAPVAIAIPALIRAHSLSPANVVVAQFAILIGALAVGEVVFVSATRGAIAHRVMYAVVYTVAMIAMLSYAVLWVEGVVFGNVL